ncbi:MAG: FAD-dependent oxidoreductase [Muribaculaceae bacterium]|nr:FAD-dependent oxidoreductase [Muribaculaceae bacterium]
MKTSALVVCAMLSAVSSLSSFGAERYDIVVLGGTPGGIMSAIEAARMGKSVVILERNDRIGGLPANGLGATDIATRGATTGLFSEFTNAVKQYYIDKYGKDSQQVKDCSDGFHFEPSVAEKVLTDMISPYDSLIDVKVMRQFNFSTGDISMTDDGKHINSVRLINRNNGDAEIYEGKVFIDATYEGDLGAAAKVPYRVGREAAWEFNEPGAGVVYEYWKSTPAEGSTGDPDNAVQAYNYRLTLTKDPKQRIPFPKPDNYNRDEYVSLIEDVWTGRHTWKAICDVTPEMIEANRKHLQNGGERSITPWDSWGIEKIVSINTVPNGKVDANNQHSAFISTDLPEENWPWPTSSWEWRDKFAKRLRDYTLGLLYFAANDPELPAQFRDAVNEWGLSATEYEDNDGFPRQVYVREGRRFEGEYFFTASDALPVAEGQRPPVHKNSITASHYALDSHAARKREEGRAHLDGFISYPTAVYTVPYGVIVTKEVDNLLLPVPVSGSHIGFSTLRMEPCWMALGQAAGAAASLAIDGETSVQNISVSDLQNRLLDEKATLIYYDNLTPDSKNWKEAQLRGLAGEVKGWKYE